MIGNLIKKVFGSNNERELKRIQPVVDNINMLEPEFNKLTDDQMLAFLETAEGKIATAKNEKLLKDIQAQMAQLYKKGDDYERAAKYYGFLLKANSPPDPNEKEQIIGGLLDVYLKWQNIESAKQLISNQLLESDINPESPLALVIDDYFSSLPSGADPNSLLGPLCEISTVKERPMWDEQLKRWSQQYVVKPSDPNTPEVEG